MSVRGILLPPATTDLSGKTSAGTPIFAKSSRYLPLPHGAGPGKRGPVFFISGAARVHRATFISMAL
jgi:hypothetical protein